MLLTVHYFLLYYYILFVASILIHVCIQQHYLPLIIFIFYFREASLIIYIIK